VFEKLRNGLSGLVEKISTTELKAENLRPVLSDFKLNLIENDVAVEVADYVCKELEERLDGVQVKRLEDRKEKISDLVRICNSPLSFRFQFLKGLSLEPSNLKETLEVWLTYFRSALIATINHQPLTVNRSRYPLSKLKKILQLIEDTIFYISTTNVNPRLALETLILELDYDPPTEEGSSRFAGSSRLPTSTLG